MLAGPAYVLFLNNNLQFQCSFLPCGPEVFSIQHGRRSAPAHSLRKMPGPGGIRSQSDPSQDVDDGDSALADDDR